jgi:hypothetical protein
VEMISLQPSVSLANCRLRRGLYAVQAFLFFFFFFSIYGHTPTRVMAMFGVMHCLVYIKGGPLALPPRI